MKSNFTRIHQVITEPEDTTSVNYREHLTRIIMLIWNLMFIGMTPILFAAYFFGVIRVEGFYISALMLIASTIGRILSNRQSWKLAIWVLFVAMFSFGVYASFPGNIIFLSSLSFVTLILLAGVLFSPSPQKILILICAITQNIVYGVTNDQSIWYVLTTTIAYTIIYSSIAYLQWLTVNRANQALRKSEAYGAELQKEINERITAQEEKIKLQSDYQFTLQHMQSSIHRITKDEMGEYIVTLDENDDITASESKNTPINNTFLHDIFSNENYEEVKPYLDRAFNGESVTYEMHVGEFYYSTTLYPSGINGSIHEVIGYTVDITDQRRSERELKLSEQRMKAFIQSTTLGVIEWDLQGKVVSWNQAAERIFGYSADWVIGKTVMGLIFPPSKQIDASSFFSEFMLGPVAAHKIVDNITHNGLLIHCEWFNSPLYDTDNQLIGATSVVQEETDRLQSEALQQALFKISQAVNSTTNLDELFRSIHEVIGSLISAKNFYIAIYDKKKNIINYPYHVDELDENPVSRVPGLGLTEYILRSGESLLVDPKKFDELVDGGKVENVGTPSVDWLGVPLKNQDQETFGVVVVQTYTEGERYSPGHLNILNFVSSQVAQAIIRKQTEERIEESEDRFRSFVEQTTDGVLLMDEDAQILEVNHSFELLSGYSREEVVGESGYTFVYKLIHPDNRDVHIFQELRSAFQSLNQDGGGKHFSRTIEFPILRKDGSIRFTQQSMFSIRTAHGFHMGAISRDITEQKKTTEALRQSEEKFRNFVENQGEGTGFVDTNEAFVYANPAAELLFGVPQGGLVGRSLREFLTDEEFHKVSLETAKRKAGEKTTYEIQIIPLVGSPITLLITATPQIDSEGRFLGSFGIFRDITERKKTEDEMRFIGTHDGLTGLYNRAYFDMELVKLNGIENFPVSIMMIDVDGLKNVNDKQGHAAGDELLKNTARLLTSCFRGHDVIARIGGDEFAVIFPSTSKETALEMLARVKAHTIQYNQDHPEKSIGISCGVSTGSKGKTLEDVLQVADANMFREKAEKKSARSA